MKGIKKRDILPRAGGAIQKLKAENGRLRDALKEIHRYCPDSGMKPGYVMAFLEKTWTIAREALAEVIE